jgi:hypothetical protein
LEQFEEDLLLFDLGNGFGVGLFLIGFVKFGYGESGVDLDRFVVEFGFE